MVRGGVHDDCEHNPAVWEVVPELSTVDSVQVQCRSVTTHVMLLHAAAEHNAQLMAVCEAAWEHAQHFLQPLTFQ